MESTCASTYMPVVVYSPQAYVPKVILILYLISSYLHFTTSYFLISYTICPSPLLSCPRCFFFVSPPPFTFLLFFCKLTLHFLHLGLQKIFKNFSKVYFFYEVDPHSPTKKDLLFQFPPSTTPAWKMPPFFRSPSPGCNAPSLNG